MGIDFEIYLSDDERRRVCFFPEHNLICEPDSEWWKKSQRYKVNPESLTEKESDGIRAMC